MLKHRYYEDPKVLHLGTMPDRAYYIPYASREEIDEDITETALSRSSRITSLNGKWSFAFIESVYDVPEAIGDVDCRDTIAVPGMWQMQGYDHHQYMTNRYPMMPSYRPPPTRIS